jgi:hypothetical protein
MARWTTGFQCLGTVIENQYCSVMCGKESLKQCDLCLQSANFCWFFRLTAFHVADRLKLLLIDSDDG